MEQTGSTIFQTLAGLWLDSGNGKDIGISQFQKLLDSFLVLNMLEFIVLVLLVHVQHRRNARLNSVQSHRQRPSTSMQDESLHQARNPSQDTPLLSSSSHSRRYTSDSNLSTSVTRSDIRKDESESRRGLLMASLCGSLLFIAWVLFLTTAWHKLGHKGTR